MSSGGAVGHGCDREGNSIVEGGSERGAGGEAHGVGPRGGIMDSHQQQFCLKWNSFGSNLATAFSNLFKSESLTDVTLFCEGVTFKAHRLILAACSKHFQELFEGMPPSPAGLIVILDGTSAHNMAALLEFMYRGEVHVSQESLSSFLKAAECLQVKGLSIEHEKLAVAQRHAAAEGAGGSPTLNGAGVASGPGSAGASSAPTNGNGNSGNGSSGNGNGTANGSNGPNSSGSSSSTSGSSVGGAAAAAGGNGPQEGGETPENGLGRGIKRRVPTTAPPSPAPTYSLPGVYSAAHYYDSPQKRLMSRSPSSVDSLGRASVLRDGAAFRPASAPHPLLENHLYQPFSHPSEMLTYPHTAPHTPTEIKRELEQEIKRERSEERERNGDVKEGVAEDLRIKQEPVSLCDRERVDKLAERLTGEFYSNIRASFDSGNYVNSTEHMQRQHQEHQQSQQQQQQRQQEQQQQQQRQQEQQQQQQQQQRQQEQPDNSGQMVSGMPSLPPAHPPTPDLGSAPATPAMWNSKINKAGTVSTPDGKKLKCPYCERLYGYETNLRAHIRQRHQGIRVPCPFCSRTFTRNNTVRRHIAREHKPELSLKVLPDAVQQ